MMTGKSETRRLQRKLRWEDRVSFTKMSNQALSSRFGRSAVKSQIIAILAASQHISQDPTIQAAKNAADASAAAASKKSFAAFGDMLLGAIAAATGGSLAVQQRPQVTQRVVH